MMKTLDDRACRSNFERVFVSKHRSRVLLLRGERIAFESESNGRFRRALLEASRELECLCGAPVAEFERPLGVDGIGIVRIERDCSADVFVSARQIAGCLHREPEVGMCG